MNNLLNPLKLATAMTLTFLVMYVACAVAVSLFPDGTLNIFNAWFHGLDLNLLKPPDGKPLTMSQFVTGTVGVILVAFPAGFVLASIYNWLLAARAKPV